MKINFCYEDGDVRLTKESEDLRDIMNSITREGTEINIYTGKDDFLHGYVSGIMYKIDEEEETESLEIYISEKYISSYERRILGELQNIYKKLDEI